MFALFWFVEAIARLGGEVLASGPVITTTTKYFQGCRLDRFLSEKRLAGQDLRYLEISPRLVSVTW